MLVNELMQVLDKNLMVEKTEIIENVMYIHCYKEKYNCKCKYCGVESSKVHSKYIRVIQDLSIQEYAVKLKIIVNKYVCSNIQCKHKTFSEKFDFIEPNAIRTNRLNEYIASIALNTSSLSTKKQLKENSNIDVSKDTILRTLKKTVK